MEKSGGIISFDGGATYYRKASQKSLRDLHKSSGLRSSVVYEHEGRTYRLIVLEKNLVYTNKVDVISDNTNEVAKPIFKLHEIVAPGGRKYEFVAVETDDAFEKNKQMIGKLARRFRNGSWLYGPCREEFRELLQDEKFFDEIALRRIEGEKQKEALKPAIQEERKREPEFCAEAENAVKNGTSTSLEGGTGDTRLLALKGKPLAVIKAGNGASFNFNNPKGFAGLGNERARDDIPNQEMAPNEALASVVCIDCNLKSSKDKFMVPTTVLFPDIESYDFTDKLPEEFRVGVNKKQLCSVQQYVENSMDLDDFLTGKTAEDLAGSLDQRSFETANILCWVLYDNDAHTGNYRVYEIEKGEGKWGLVKIDNGLIFPEKIPVLLTASPACKTLKSRSAMRGK